MPAENTQSITLVMGIFLLLLFVWAIIQQMAIFQIKKNQKILFAGSGKKDLEKILLDLKQKMLSMDSDIKNIYAITEKIGALSHKGLHKVGIVRFNPFRDIGGDQSFSVALLDGDDNGVVISSLYSRDGVRVYAKQLKNGTSSKHQLTEEEKHAIKIASAEKTNTKDKKKI